ncbi:MAG: DUF5695 domain-containing protein [Tepidisphaeraceae bacterium]
MKASMIHAGLFVVTLASIAGAADPVTEDVTKRPADWVGETFRATVGPNGISSLKYPGDTFVTDYIAHDRTLGSLQIVYRTDAGAWRTIRTADLTATLRKATTQPAGTGWESVARDGDLEIIQSFTPSDSGPATSLVWSFRLVNHGTTPLEVGDLAVLSPFNTDLGENANNAETTSLEAHQRILTQRQIPHWWIAGNGSFIFLERPNGVGPFLVMTPTGTTRLETFDEDRPPRPTTRPATQTRRRQADRLFYIHSTAAAEQLAKQTEAWQKQTGFAEHAPATRLGHTSLVLAPGGKADYGFALRFTPATSPTPYQGVRDVLYAAGKPDITVAPGMTVPTDLTATIAVRSKVAIDALEPEFPDRTTVAETTAPPTAPAGTRLFRIKFAKLGENLLTIRCGDQKTTMEFFVTEPLEIVIKKRAAFLVSHCQWTNTGKWYDGVFTEWDAIKKVLRSPDDLDRLFRYILTCDDPGLGKAPFLASKNAFLPEQKEVTALDAYMKSFVWGKLQMTDKERHPFAIYGIDDWHANRASTKPGVDGQDHVWRIYDYPHIVLLYYRMYQIASYYPAIKTDLKPSEYLDRAYGTAMAYFEVPTRVNDWSAYYTGTYNEVIIPDLIDALVAAGRSAEADKLRAHWEQKVKAFVFAEDPYLYGSEYAFDSTTFEGSAALAKWAVERMAKPGYVAPPQLADERVKNEPPRKPEAFPAVTAQAANRFMERQLAQNLSDRGWLENCYYYQGSDFRGGFGSGYVLSYMSQMGGWGVLDYALHHAKDDQAAAPLLRLGYASTLSSWALVNSGTRESNYGYWFPGPDNDGAASGGFEPRPFARQWIGKVVPRGAWQYANEIDLGFSGALRSATTLVTNDPLFGPIAFGGELATTPNGYAVLPRDGLRQRLSVRLAGNRIDLELAHDAFAGDTPVEISADGKRVRFKLENRTGPAHLTVLRVHGATNIKVQGLSSKILPANSGGFDVELSVPSEPGQMIELDLNTAS